MNINPFSRSSGINTQSLSQSQAAKNTQLERLASGRRINSAKDDAAGLVISTKLETQDRSTQAALRNSLDGTSRLQVESGALTSVTEDLQRIRELKLQQGNGILNDQDKAAIQSEIDQRSDTINSVFTQTEFNQKPVFEEGIIGFQTGPNPGDQIELSGKDFDASFNALGFTAGTELSVDQIDQALGMVADRQGELGAIGSRLSANAEFLQLKSENNQAANSRIKDTDVAQTASEKTKLDILGQVAISVQSQANISSRFALKLLET